MKNNTIKVEFINNANGETIGITELTPNQLPKTFSKQTTMHILEDDWNVEEAIPESSEDFIKSGKLTLKMRKVEYMNPNDIWFSLPTLENNLPKITNQPIFTDFAIQIHQDDWLQQEFISNENSEHIDDFLTKIKKSAEECNDTGEITIYKNCFVREFPTDKITQKINLSDIKHKLNSNEIGSLSFGEDNFAENVFVIPAFETYFYGELDKDNFVKSFGVLNIGNIENVQDIEKFANEMKFNFVDWVGMYQIKTT